jgi:hypothetical protein
LALTLGSTYFVPWYCLAVEFSSLLCLIVTLLFSDLPAPSLGQLLASATVYLSTKKKEEKKKKEATTGDKLYCVDSTVPTGFALLSLGFQKRSLEKALAGPFEERPQAQVHLCPVSTTRRAATHSSPVPSLLLAQVAFAHFGRETHQLLGFLRPFPIPFAATWNGLVWCRLVLFSALLPVQHRTAQDATVLGTITQHLGALSIITISFHFSFVLFYPDSISILDP